MFFTFVITILNAAGWLCYYFFSGGFFESTETASVRFITIFSFILCSVIAGIASFLCTHVFNSLLLNAGNNILTTAFISAPFIFLVYPNSMYQKSVKEVILVFVFYLLAFFSYFALCVWPTLEMGYGDRPIKLAFIFCRFIMISAIIIFLTKYPTLNVGQFIFTCGLVISAPMSIVLAIRSKIID